MYISIRVTVARVCLCKECNIQMYASIKVSVVRACSYKACTLP